MFIPMGGCTEGGAVFFQGHLCKVLREIFLKILHLFGKMAPQATKDTDKCLIFMNTVQCSFLLF